jgi:hypothetical protein
MLNDLICDYNFKAGDRAQYVFCCEEGEEEQTIIVQILDINTVAFEKLYVVCAHKDLLKKAYLEEDSTLAEQYNISDTHSAVYLDPDELIPAFRSLYVAVDNSELRN